jgi:predicted 3-demethylubiquinone-9 3-methyltransferase (glyoxalase superfamily)
MQKITPNLWFGKEAKEAAEFYVSLFPDSKVTNITTLHDTPSGDCDVVSFELSGQPFMAISAGPLFKFTPAVSFLVACSTKKKSLYSGGNSRQEARRSCRWEKIRSVKNTAGCRTATAFHGR